jgi:hypothetical protein
MAAGKHLPVGNFLLPFAKNLFQTCGSDVPVYSLTLITLFQRYTSIFDRSYRIFGVRTLYVHKFRYEW